MKTKEVFICGAHKSGSSLLRSLFYKHSDTGVVPIETHSPLLFGWPSLNPMRSKLGHLSSDEKKRNIVKHIDDYFKSKSRFSDALIVKGNRDDLINQIDNLEPCFNRESLYSFYNLLIEKLSTQQNQYNTLIEKSVTNAEQASALNQIFPEAKFIHIIRNPYSNLVSLRKYNSELNEGPFLQKLIELLRLDYYYLIKNRRLFPDNYLTVRYEDLITETEDVMKRIFSFIDLPFDASTIQPTDAVGKIWKGNSTHKTEFQGISSKNIDKWEKEIHPLEIQLCNLILSGIIEREGYSKIESRGSIWKRFPNEGIKRYVHNRSILKSLTYWTLE